MRASACVCVCACARVDRLPVFSICFVSASVDRLWLCTECPRPRSGPDRAGDQSRVHVYSRTVFAVRPARPAWSSLRACVRACVRTDAGVAAGTAPTPLSDVGDPALAVAPGPRLFTDLFFPPQTLKFKNF